MWRTNGSEGLGDESGVALVFALLAVIILAGLAVVFVSRAYTENRATFSEQRYETTIHTAEAGVDDLIKTLNRNFDFVTAEPAPSSDEHVFVDSDGNSLVGASEAAQRAWAVDIASDQDRCTLVTTEVGEACAIRPRIDSDTGPVADFVFGVGFSPDRTEADKIRVVKLGIELGVFIPAQAILTQGDLNPLNITICGEDRDVHSNGTMRVLGSADTVTPGTKGDDCAQEASGKVTSFGAFSTNGNPDIDPASGQTGQKVDVPSVSSAEVYEMYLHPEHPARECEEGDTDGDRVCDDYADDWYNLCPDGTARGPYFPLNYDLAGEDPDPCVAGNTDILYPPASGPTPSRFNGWKPPNNNTSPWSAGGGNSPSGAPLVGGIYYVYERNADMSGGIGNDVQVTLLADAKGHIRPFERKDQPSDFNALSPTRTCALDGKNDGNISIQGVGGGDMNPFLVNQLFVADRDVSMGGNISSEMRGIIAAHEQTGLGGTPDITGAVVAEDACRDSAQSPESTNSITGNFHVDHSFENVSTLPSVVHITAWNEY